MSSDPKHQLVELADDIIDGARGLQLVINKALAESELANASVKSAELVANAERAKQLLEVFQSEQGETSGE